MQGITAEALFKQIEAYRSPNGQAASMRQKEPYLFEAIDDKGGDIPGNDDYLIEALTDADLDCSVDIV